MRRNEPTPPFSSCPVFGTWMLVSSTRKENTKHQIGGTVMQFYKIEGIITNPDWTKENDKRHILRERAGKICLKTTDFNQAVKGQSCFYVTDASDNIFHAGIICRESSGLQKQIQDYLAALELSVENLRMEEITFNAAHSLLQTACRHNYIDDDDEILERFNLDKLRNRFGKFFDYDEKIIDKAAKSAVYKEADAFSAGESLRPELDRIYAGKSMKKAIGHPVHYIVQTDDSDTRQKICHLLLQALYAIGRLRSRRCCQVRFCPGEQFSSSTYDCLYQSCVGGSMIVRYITGDDREDDYASSSRYMIEWICKTMKKYRNQVLTIFVLPRECTGLKDIFYENLGNASFVELKEDFMNGDTAVKFLKGLAKTHGIRCDKKLFSMLEEDQNYLTPDLHMLFDTWYDRKLKASVYPQYCTVKATDQAVLKSTPKGSSYTELMEMIGLTEAKKIIRQALAYAKAQKLFSEKGMTTSHLSMHMVFSGNPGTAKMLSRILSTFRSCYIQWN